MSMLDEPGTLPLSPTKTLLVALIWDMAPNYKYLGPNGG